MNLEKKLEAVTAKINQLKGRKAAVEARLKDEFNLTTLEQAQDQLTALATEVTTLETQYEKDYANFISEHGPTLEAI